MWQRYLRPILGLLLIGGMLAGVGCSYDKPTVPQQSPKALGIDIVAGPDEASPVDFGSKVTFKWQPVGGSGTYTFKYQIDDGSKVNVPEGQTSIILSDTTVLKSGSHTFKIEVNDGTEAKTATKSFVVKSRGASDTEPPTITVTFPPDGYKAAPGSSVRFAWTVSDASNSSSPMAKAGVKKVGWAVDDTAASASWALSENIPLTGTGDNLAVGWHYIYIQAQDLSGNVSIQKDSVEIIEPTIMYVNETVLEPGYSGDTPPLTEADEFRRSRYFDSGVFGGFSVVEWDVATQGYPETADIPASVTTIVWVGSGDYQNSSWGWNVGWEYTYSILTGGGPAPNVLTTFIDNGGKVWITGENWLDEINVGISDVRDSTLEFMYLGMDTTWAATGPPEVVYDFTPVRSGWPSLSSDIAKVSAGIGDGGGWACDYFPVDGDSVKFKANVEPLYRVSGYDVGGTSTPPPENDWYAAWVVNDANGDPQVVFMGFDVYYFSFDAGKDVGYKILHDLFGN